MQNTRTNRQLILGSRPLSYATTLVYPDRLMMHIALNPVHFTTQTYKREIFLLFSVAIEVRGSYRKGNSQYSGGDDDVKPAGARGVVRPKCGP